MNNEKGLGDIVNQLILQVTKGEASSAKAVLEFGGAGEGTCLELIYRHMTDEEKIERTRKKILK